METFRDLQSFYKTTLSKSISASDGTIIVAAAPAITTGYLIIEPNTANEEIVLMTNAVTTTLTVTRGLATSGSSESAGTGKSHPAGVSVIIADAHYYIKRIQISKAFQFRGAFADLTAINAITNPEAGDLAINISNGFTYYYNGASWVVTSGGTSPADASTTTKGITKMSVAPASATNPISVGDNDPRVPSQAENDALVGNFGTPGSSNRYVTEQFGSGMIYPFAGFTAPAGHLLCDGAAVSRATYANLAAVIMPTLGAVTVTIASPGVFTLTSHGLVLDDKIYLTTTGALPTNLAINTIYYVISAGLTADEFQVSATKGGAAINTSGSQSGIHTAVRCPYGLGDGSTTFNVPNLKGAIPVGRDTAQAEFNSVGETGGEKTHVLTEAELAAHTHPIINGSNGGSTAGRVSAWSGTGTLADQATGSAGGGAAHNNLQPYIAMNYIIKT